MLTLALRDLRAHAGRYVLTFLAAVIGVGFVAGVITLTDTISRTVDDLFATDGRRRPVRRATLAGCPTTRPPCRPRWRRS